MVLAGFQHRPGVHCGSTALADALRARGPDLSEPTAFGLGAGLGFYSPTGLSFSPTHLVQCRQWLEVGAPIEKRGPGGGSFRLLRASSLEDERRFHEEVAALVP